MPVTEAAIEDNARTARAIVANWQDVGRSPGVQTRRYVDEHVQSGVRQTDWPESSQIRREERKKQAVEHVYSRLPRRMNNHRPESRVQINVDTRGRASARHASRVLQRNRQAGVTGCLFRFRRPTCAAAKTAMSSARPFSQGEACRPTARRQAHGTAGARARSLRKRGTASVTTAYN